MSKILVTISREHGTNGQKIGKILSEKLSVPYYDNKLMADNYMGEKGRRYFENSGETVPADSSYGNIITFYTSNKSINEEMYREQSEVIKKLADEGSGVFVGRCADYVLRDYEGLVRVFISAELDARVHNIMKDVGLDEKSAKDHIKKIDKSRITYYKYYTENKWGSRSNYDLCINTSKLTPSQAADVIAAYIANINK